MTDDRKSQRIGMICAFSCMVYWGFMPIYWKTLIPINSYVIILYRIFLVGVTCFAGALIAYGWTGIKEALGDKKKVLKLFLAGLVITINWSVYIYAVNSGQVIETCIGYYIEPLVICLFGIVLFKERPNKYKMISIIFASIGVLIILIHFSRLPFIALMLAISFSTYAAIKKHIKMPALLSLLCETIFIAPVAFIIVIYLEANGNGAIAAGQPYQLALLALAGILTAIPLALFAAAANRISMISIGIAEYVSPSITLLIGIFLFKEPFDQIQLIAFAVIWIGLVFFTYGEIRGSRNED